MRAIKLTVVFMTLLLVAGLGLLGYGLYSKSGDLVKSTGSSVLSNNQAIFETQNIILPHDGIIEQWLPVGNSLVMVIKTNSGSQLVVLDPAQGRELGRFITQPDTPR